MGKVVFEIRGVQYHQPPYKLRDMEKLAPLKARVTREKTNPVDRNAFAVFIIEKPFKDNKLGYLSKEVAAEYAPLYDKGKLSLENARIDEIDVDGRTAKLSLRVSRI